MNKLRAARLDQGLSISTAAERIGVSYGTLSRAERGERIRVANAKQIADFFGLKVTDFVPVENVTVA